MPYGCKLSLWAQRLGSPAVTGLILMLALALTPGCGGPSRGAPTEAGRAVYHENRIIRGYDPKPNLVVPRTRVERARFPAVDVHCHWSIDADPHAMLAAMDELNISHAVNLSGGWGDDLAAMLAKFGAVSRERYIIFCNVDFSRIDEPGFGAAAADALREAHAAGARGLKIFKSLGLRHRDAAGNLVAVDDPRIDPIWARAGELGMPVLIHTADPAAFFQPADADNERWMQLQRHPDWSFYGDGFPSREQLLAGRDRIVGRHPATIFIGAHVGSDAGDLAAVGEVMDRHPNFYVDISGRVGELGRQPYAARRFLLEHRDRILFGTDRYPGNPRQPRYHVYYRFLETEDEYFDYFDHPFPPAGEWKIYGVHLPDEVLAKIYRDNAARIFGVDAGGP